MENLRFGLGITAVGMGLVFSLLGLLWLLLWLVGRIDTILPAGRGGEEAAPAEAAPAGRVVVSGEGAQDLGPDALAAIAVAVLAHTAARRRQAAPAMRSTKPGSQIYASRWLASGRERQTHGFTPRR